MNSAKHELIGDTQAVSRPARKRPPWRWFIVVGTVMLLLAIVAVWSGTFTPPAPIVDPAVQQREATLADREAAVAAKETGLSSWEAALRQRTTELDQREAAIKAQEVQIEAGTIPGSGTYLVGTDVPAGVYRTAGPTQGHAICYFAWLADTGADARIVDNSTTAGPATVTVRDGQVFKTSGCQPFHLR